MSANIYNGSRNRRGTKNGSETGGEWRTTDSGWLIHESVDEDADAVGPESLCGAPSCGSRDGVESLSIVSRSGDGVRVLRRCEACKRRAVEAAERGQRMRSELADMGVLR